MIDRRNKTGNIRIDTVPEKMKEFSWKFDNKLKSRVKV
jgi:hypothetical protein